MIRRGAHRAFLAALAGVWLAGATAAHARPRRPDAKLAFDRGVAAYQKGNYEAAAEALGKSFALERDVDTLFAWAQAERKLERCDKAIELYETLLSYPLPVANKAAVEQKLAECRAVVAHDAPAPPGVTTPQVAPEPSPPTPADDAAPSPSVADASPASARPGPPIDTGAQPPAWYSEPVALTLLGSGVVASAVGTWFLLSARSIGDDASAAAVYQDTVDLRNKARQCGVIGAVSTISGGALIAGGIVWILLRPSPAERHTVSGWLTPGGGGLAIGGPF